ncbi:MAG: tRNA uridine-5-carboxymethylaminomethyl(34) synthesis enzyme MnmG [Phycisphaerales bacterium]|nr:tRNA uridine-5-carboxymethylaminomethyl(34) synthesis enzyme MnmG [Phycisphaerales bacterium]
MNTHFKVIVVGGGHAGIEAAWAAANRLGESSSVALISIDESKIGVMSCNPAIGGLAKGQLVREVDAMGGLMGLIADATGIQFKVLNTSKGSAVHGPRCQSDKVAYSQVAQSMIKSRDEIQVIEGTVEEILTTNDHSKRIVGVRVANGSDEFILEAPSVVVTTGTFMRGLMHMGSEKTEGGRFGEKAATGISKSLNELGFELGRLKTGTPPRLAIDTIEWDNLQVESGDEVPVPFSELSTSGWSLGSIDCTDFPRLEQVTCRQSSTCEDSHEIIRQNLDRAPMFTGQIESSGPRYCPSIEDKVVRFEERSSHGVFLEPESHETNWVYCNGIATSLPSDVQDEVIRRMPGCENAEILQYGYAVEYDMVRPHQIYTTGETRSVNGLFLAGQINGTSGYEEAAAQGFIAGLNAALLADLEDEYKAFSFDRDQAYIGVLMDDLVTKTPREPYRMFTSRAEHRLILRADNAPDRLTPIAKELGLLDTTNLGAQRWSQFEERIQLLEQGQELINSLREGEKTYAQRILDPDFTAENLIEVLEPHMGKQDRGIWQTLHSNKRYEPYIERQLGVIKRNAELEHRPLPEWISYDELDSLRTEARQALEQFRPTTFGQASRLEGITPADVTLLSVLIKRARASRREALQE